MLFRQLLFQLLRSLHPFLSILRSLSLYPFFQLIQSLSRVAVRHRGCSQMVRRLSCFSLQLSRCEVLRRDLCCIIFAHLLQLPYHVFADCAHRLHPRGDTLFLPGHDNLPIRRYRPSYWRRVRLLFLSYPVWRLIAVQQGLQSRVPQFCRRTRLRRFRFQSLVCLFQALLVVQRNLLVCRSHQGYATWSGRFNHLVPCPVSLYAPAAGCRRTRCCSYRRVWGGVPQRAPSRKPCWAAVPQPPM